jgi:hypothetical protein
MEFFILAVSTVTIIYVSLRFFALS